MSGSEHRAHLSTRLAIAVTALIVALTLASCGDADEDRAGGRRLSVVTTVAPITNIVATIVGDRAEVRGIVPEGVNSHTFEPRPSDAEALSEADVLYMNGLSLEEPTRELAEATMSTPDDIVELGPLAITEDQYRYDFSFPRSGGKPNPHLWTDPTLVQRYAEIVAADMSARDPANADHYATNLAAFMEQIDRFDAAMRASFATVPVKKLLTYHDAYAYFAETYGWSVIGAIQVDDFGDPSPAEVAALIEQVRASGVPAIFGSEVFPSPVLALIGEEAGVRYVDELRDDDLPGAPGDAEHSWLGLMRFDFVTMTEALGGDASALRQFDITPVAPDLAEYPQ